MNDFFADLEQDLLDATRRDNEGRRRRWLPAPPRLSLGPALAAAATVAAVAAVLALSGGEGSGGDERAASPPTPTQEDGRGAGDFDHDKAQDSGDGEIRCVVDLDGPRLTSEVAREFPVFSSPARDDLLPFAIKPQGDLVAYDEQSARVLGGAGGRKTALLAALVGDCDTYKTGLCLVAARDADDYLTVCSSLGGARSGAVRLTYDRWIAGAAPDDARRAVIEGIGVFEVEDNVYAGEVGDAGERALTAPIRFE